MESIVIILRPRDNFFVVCWIRIDANYDLRPFGIAIIPGHIGFADARRSAINRIQMHRGMHRRKRFTKRNVLGDGFIAQLIEEIGAPIPLQARRIEGIEHTLQCGWGIGPTKSSAGFLKARMGLKVCSAFSCGPAYAQTTPHIFFMCRSSGKGGAGGTVRNAKKPFKSSGAPGISSRYHFMTSVASLNS